LGILLISKEKYFKAKEGIVIFDRSEQGKLLLKGSDRIDLLNRLCATDLRNLNPYNSSHLVLTNEKGRILDLLFILHKNDKSILITGENNNNKIKDWLDTFTFTEDFTVEDITSNYNILLIMGDKRELLFEKLKISLNSIYNGKFIETSIDNISVIIYNDRFGINIITEKKFNCDLNNLINKIGIELGLTDIDFDIFNSLRIEKGLPLYGYEIIEKYNPYEVNLIHYVSFNKGCYPGQEVIARIDSQDKIQKNLCGLIFEKTDVNYEEILSSPKIFLNDIEVGIVTSIGYSVGLNSYIGLGIIKRNFIDSKLDLYIKVQYKIIKIIISDLPFKV